MSQQLQFRGGTTTQHSTFIGADREVTIDTDKHVPVVHDGTTPGGYPLALALSGTTINRPSFKYIGMNYFDITLNIPIWWNGSVWVNSVGNEV